MNNLFSGLTPYKDLEYFPKYALSYFAWSLVILFAVLFIVDRVVLEQLETQGLLASTDWRTHTQNAANMMLARNKASKLDPIWRSEAFPVSEKCSRSKRILVLGDSFVWGHGLSNMNHTWWRQLQLEIDRRGYDVEVIGAGVCGANTRDELEWAKHLSIKFKPDLILWSYVINDPIELDKTTKQPLVKHRYKDTNANGLFHYGPPEFEGPAGFFHMLWPKVVTYLEHRRNINYAYATSSDALGYEWSIWELKLLEGKNFEQYKETVKEVSQFISDSKVPQLFVMMVFPTQKKFEDRLRPVETLFRDYRIPYLDLLPEMLLWYKARFSRIPGVSEFVLGATPVDAHPGPIINHYYAINTLNDLEKNHPEVLGTRVKDFSKNISANDFEFNDWAPVSMNLKKIDEGTFSIEYPKNDEAIFLMPFRRPYVQCNFSKPVKFKAIELSGEGLKSASIILGVNDVATHEYKVGQAEFLGEKIGKKLLFVLPVKELEIVDIKISAEFATSDRNLQFKLKD